MRSEENLENEEIRRNIRQLQPGKSNKRRSVICYLPQNTTSYDIKEEYLNNGPSNVFTSVISEKFTPKMFETPELILSQTSSVNLMTIPKHHIRELEIRIQEASKDQEKFSPHVLKVAKLELAFLLSKECVSFWTESIKSIKEDVSPPMIYSAVQEYFIQIMVLFLNTCPHFQSLSGASQARLLRKNMADVSILLLTMSFQRRNQVFRWGLGGNDLERNKVIEITEEILTRHLSADMGKDIFQVINSIAKEDIPGHLLVLLILITIFSRDGVLMEKQNKIDLAHNYYRHLLFLYIKSTRQESSRLNATLHRLLKTVRDFADEIRTQGVLNTGS